MKNILLIGGSHGIGFEMAKNLHEGNNVFIASRTNDQLGNLNVNHLPFDATKDAIEALELPDELHGFAYCPGSINLKPLKMLSIEAFREEMELNFFALAKVVKHIMPKMQAGSSMVFFSTVAVGTGMPFHTSVAAAKGAIEGFSRSLAAEYAPRVRVNCIAPSLIDTPLAGRLLNNDKKREAMAERHPLKRVGRPEDISNLALFLLREESSWLTGQVLGVDGGMSTLNIS
mgnify:CR=1 FL=1